MLSRSVPARPRSLQPSSPPPLRGIGDPPWPIPEPPLTVPWPPPLPHDSPTTRPHRHRYAPHQRRPSRTVGPGPTDAPLPHRPGPRCQSGHEARAGRLVSRCRTRRTSVSAQPDRHHQGTWRQALGRVRWILRGVSSGGGNERRASGNPCPPGTVPHDRDGRIGALVPLRGHAPMVGGSSRAARRPAGVNGGAPLGAAPRPLYVGRSTCPRLADRMPEAVESRQGPGSAGSSGRRGTRKWCGVSPLRCWW